MSTGAAFLSCAALIEKADWQKADFLVGELDFSSDVDTSLLLSLGAINHTIDYDDSNHPNTSPTLLPPPPPTPIAALN